MMRVENNGDDPVQWARRTAARLRATRASFSDQPAETARPYLKDEVDCAMRQSRETSFIKGLSKACSNLTVRFLDCAIVSDKQGFNSFEDLS